MVPPLILWTVLTAGLPCDEPRLPPDALETRLPAFLLPVEAPTGDLRIDALNSGYRWAIPVVTVSFYTMSVFNGTYYGAEAGVREVSDPVKQNYRAIFAMSRQIFGLTLQEIPETSSAIGQIRIVASDGPAYAYCYYPSSSAVFHVAGDCHFKTSYDRLGDTNGFQHGPGYHGYLTLIHELGHALGLKHPHQGTPTLPTADDSTRNTVMSYTTITPSPSQWQPYDRVVLPWLYGPPPTQTPPAPPTNARLGDTQ